MQPTQQKKKKDSSTRISSSQLQLLSIWVYQPHGTWAFEIKKSCGRLLRWLTRHRVQYEYQQKRRINSFIHPYLNNIFI
jgi:hypothetical protein